MCVCVCACVCVHVWVHVCVSEGGGGGVWRTRACVCMCCVCVYVNYLSFCVFGMGGLYMLFLLNKQSVGGWHTQFEPSWLTNSTTVFISFL